jgi:beta-lactamase superfamily II metal-dependent hydrolase
MANITLTRRFHAVGQGLFCSETVEYANFKHTVVYDCGTEQSSRNLNSKIGKLREKLLNDSIDILFISHLHRDHISGWEELNAQFQIRRIVLPKLEPIDLVRAYMDASEYRNSNSIDVLRSFIQSVINNREERASRFHEVPSLSFNPFESNEESDPSNQVTRYREYIRQNYLFHIANPVDNSHLVEYIPFNIQDEKSFLFNELFEKHYLFAYQHLINGDISPLEDSDTFKKIKKLYRNIYGNLNESSMPVLSHVVNNRMKDCLYTGDYSHIADKDTALLRCYYKPVWNDISWLQVPHHGSKLDNPRALYAGAHFESIISFGENNRYDHPHKTTIDTINKETHISPIEVTQTSGTYIVPITI